MGLNKGLLMAFLIVVGVYFLAAFLTPLSQHSRQRSPLGRLGRDWVSF
jgi:hypothetical protein